LGLLFKHVIGLSLEEAMFSSRGFHAENPRVRDRLEHIGRTFISGYNQALTTSEPGALTRQLENSEKEVRGFAFEGAAMALALLDNLTPWKTKRVQQFLVGPAAHHVYMVHVGVGWAIGRLPWLRQRLDKFLSQFDPLLRWLALDGYGFHEGYFHSHQHIQGQRYPQGLSQYAQRAFDQGLGRSLWFVHGAGVDRIQKSIATFPLTRRVDLWAGAGLAAAYAGSVGPATLKTLKHASGYFGPQLAQGAAFAARARELAGNPAEHTNLACEIFCGLSADESARVTQLALLDLPPDCEREPAYETWRKRIQSHFSPQAVSA
jgi:hypothetical protein